jgi:glyoxylase-like metal-dependent hydrolase (beta-lactamase superfamily II)
MPKIVGSSRIVNRIDLMHLGNDRAIAAHELDCGLIVDPGPESCLETLLAGLREEPRALLLTHIHLDHAGASGTLARRFGGLQVYVHEIGAPHLVDPERLLRSAERLYGDDMARLWGRFEAVPEERITALAGGETVEGLEVMYAPGHASHHVVYLDHSSGDAYVGDVAGVRIPPSEHVVAPTPPPDIDLEAWERTLDALAERGPARLHLTHFGAAEPAGDAIAAVREALRTAAERSRDSDRGAFEDAASEELETMGEEIATRVEQTSPVDQCWLGLERYWRKRREAAQAT